MPEFIKQVIISLILTTILELWSRKSLRKPLRYNDESPLGPKMSSPKAFDYSNDSHSAIKSFLRLILSPLVGFFLSAFTAGILKAEGYKKIPLESTLAIVFIIFWTLVVWQLLYRYGPLKGKKRNALD